MRRTPHQTLPAGLPCADIHVVALQLGHKDLRMAARYQHLAPTFLQDAVRRLDGVFSPQLAQKTSEPKHVSGSDGVTMATLNGHKPALTSASTLPV
jgi:hypothetical protein